MYWYILYVHFFYPGFAQMAEVTRCRRIGVIRSA